MRRMPTRAFSERHRMLMRLLAVLVVMVLAVLCCPATAVQVQAASEVSKGVLGKSAGSSGIAALGKDKSGKHVEHSKVRMVTFSDKTTKKVGDENCWDASKDHDESVVGCATSNADGTWNVVYTGNGSYPTFPADSSSLFYGWSSLTSIVNLEHIDTSKVTNMAGMFQDCKSLVSLNLSGFNTTNVTDMNSMFTGCGSLTSLNLWNFQTPNVTDMRFMFRGCSSLTSLNLSSFNTSKVTDMSYMFADCGNLSSLNLSNFDTSNAQNMSDMFSGCSSLTSLDLSSLRTPKVEDISGMFSQCRSLTSLNLSNFDTSKVKESSKAFDGLSNLERLVLGAEFTLQPDKLGLGNPHSSAKPGQRPTHKWRDKITGAEYGPSQIPASRSRVTTYEAGYEATTYRYKVIFSRNDGTFGTTEQSFTSGTTHTLQRNIFTRPGYRFTGWNTNADGGGRRYADGQQITDLGNREGDVVTLFAQWEPIAKTHTIQFNSHGGTTIPSQRVANGMRAPKPSDPRRTGYMFVGWTVDQAGKRPYDFRNPVSASMTLHAQWKPIPQLKRLGGPDRYGTMAKIVGEAYPQTADTVIVASGENYPDALAASGLAGALNAPILLTTPHSLSHHAAMQLARLRPRCIIIAGGPHAVSWHVQRQLGKYARIVERHGGVDRYDTSYRLYLRGKGSWKATAIVVTGENYADALSVSSYAFAGKAPVLLSNPHTGLTRHQRAALAKFARVTVVGGPAAVPARHTIGLPGCVRLGGADRYQTSVLFVQWALRNGLGMDGVVFARGGDFPDALVAGPLAGRNRAAILLVEGSASPSIRYGRGFSGKISKAYVVGGPQAVSQGTADAIADALRIRRL